MGQETRPRSFGRKIQQGNEAELMDFKREVRELFARAVDEGHKDIDLISALRDIADAYQIVVDVGKNAKTLDEVHEKIDRFMELIGMPRENEQSEG